MKVNWIAVPIITAGLMLIGGVGGAKIELPSYKDYFKNLEGKKYKTYMMVVPSVACAHRAKAFVNRLKVFQDNGILGAEAYVRSHRVRVYYNPDEITPEKIEKIKKIRVVSRKWGWYGEGEDFKRFRVSVENIKTPRDALFLISHLSFSNAIGRADVFFGKPPTVVVYFLPDSISPSQIRDKINAKELTIYTNDGPKNVEGHFECVDTGCVVDTGFPVDLDSIK